MATFVYIDNYRGFSRALIPLRRVNWLVGENSTGKTSFLELLQVFSAPPFWFLEPRFSFAVAHPRHFLDLVSASSRNKTSFTVGAVFIDGTGEITDVGMFATYVNVDGRPLPKRVTLIERGKARTVDGKLWINRKGEPYRARIQPCLECNGSMSESERALRHISAHSSGVGFLQREVSEDKVGSPLFERCSETFFDGKSILEREPIIPFPFGDEFVDLAPIRTKPRRTYDSPQTEFSPEGEHTPYVIRKRLASKGQAEEFRAFLERSGKQSGLFRSIRVRTYGRGAQAPFEVQVVLGDTPLGLENVGYGVSQALPVLVEMFDRPEQTAFTIQQPEVHLHPKAQASFGDLVAELSRKEEKKFVIETHSDFAIDRFRLNVRSNGPISSQLLYFERTNTGNVASSIPIDNEGNLPEDQPPGYREFFYNESLSLLG